MNANFDEVIREATALLEELFRKKGMLPKGKKLEINAKIVDAELVSLKLDPGQQLDADTVDLLLSKPISYLKLSNRVEHLLTKNGFVCVGDVARKSPTRLLEIEKFGPTAFYQVKERLIEEKLWHFKEGFDVEINSYMTCIAGKERIAVLNGPFNAYTQKIFVDEFNIMGIKTVKEFLDADKKVIKKLRGAYEPAKQRILERLLIGRDY